MTRQTLYLTALTVLAVGCVTIYTAKNHSNIDLLDEEHSGLEVPINVDASKENDFYTKDTILVQQVDTSKNMDQKKPE